MGIQSLTVAVLLELHKDGAPFRYGFVFPMHHLVFLDPLLAADHFEKWDY